VQTGAWILPDERPLPEELEAFLGAGAPPVYVGFGSIPMRASTDVARVVIEAIRAHGRRVLVARGWTDLALIDDQDDCFVVGEVNHQALFSRVAAVVHHGGAGTTTTAALAGAPQLVVPQIVDQPYWAGRVAELGISAAHDGPTPMGEQLAAQGEQLASQAELIKLLQEELAELRRRLGRDSSNSSTPSSKDSIAAKAKKKADRSSRVRSKDRKPGGQPGRAG
jgi:UDP:flavonoid glycosyltransferase YjiC (YdhE family)